MPRVVPKSVFWCLLVESVEFKVKSVKLWSRLATQILVSEAEDNSTVLRFTLLTLHYSQRGKCAALEFAQARETGLFNLDGC